MHNLIQLYATQCGMKSKVLVKSDASHPLE